MNYILNTFYLFVTFRFAESVDSYITGGSITPYNKYPHSVFLDISCRARCMCGGSILNQYIVLTAAHCIYQCLNGYVGIKYGHEDIYKMKTTKMARYVEHEEYDDDLVLNDICLVMAEDKIPLNKDVKRVIAMVNPPKSKYANVAGWGMDETGHTVSILRQVRVEMQKPNVCSLITEDNSHLPPGAFCAGPVTGLGSADRGDSGSALIVNEYVQIGLVSYKCHLYSMVAYTNISYYLRWIRKNSKRLYCYK